MLLSMHNLVGGYNAIRIVNGVSFELAAGETLAVLGRNGVGKTTLLRALVGLADRFAGEVLIDDQPVVARDPRCLARLGVAFVRELGVKVTVLHEGAVIAEGSLDQVSADERVIEVYLGR